MILKMRIRKKTLVNPLPVPGEGRVRVTVFEYLIALTPTLSSNGERESE